LATRISGRIRYPDFEPLTDFQRRSLRAELEPLRNNQSSTRPEWRGQGVFPAASAGFRIEPGSDMIDADSRRILVINGKGGCGKTTIATNLAVAYASAGRSVALVDNDPQASSTYWSEVRGQSLPPVQLVAAHQRTHMYQTHTFQHRLPASADRIIVDGHSNARDRDLEALLKQADVVLVPMLPSAIDIRAGGQFITSLLTQRAFRNSPRPVGVIANRVQPNTETHAKLEHFLRCLDVPAVATFRDSPVYTQAVELGKGVVDMLDSRAARRETPEWRRLIKWIDSQPKASATTVHDLRMRPAAATKAAGDEARPVDERPLSA